MNKVYVESVGLIAPGLEGWLQSLAVLRGEEPYLFAPLPKYKPQLLPPNERRRATELVRLAFRVCEDCVDQAAHVSVSELASVFSSAGGDYQVIDQICRVLTQPEPMVSPTQFHNSVHNSAAGYWSIATQAKGSSTSIAAGAESFATGLLEAIGLCVNEKRQVLFSCYDAMPPEPLDKVCGIEQPFGSAFILSPEKTDHSLAALAFSVVSNTEPESLCDNPVLKTLSRSGPAAQALPLLESLACEKAACLRWRLSTSNLLELVCQLC